MAPPPFSEAPVRNRLLAALPPEELDHLRPYLEPVSLTLREVLQPRNQRIDYLHFIEQGLGSTLVRSKGDGEIEAGLMGREGLVGIPVVLGDDRAPCQVIVQGEGRALRIESGHIRRVMGESAAVRSLLLRYAHAFMIQVSQTAVCNRLHNVEERLARWLLMSHDRLETDTLPLTQEFLSYMLGVRRAGVTVAVGTLDAAGIVRHARGRITVVDRERLEAASCPCYAEVSAEFQRILG